MGKKKTHAWPFLALGLLAAAGITACRHASATKGNEDAAHVLKSALLRLTAEESSPSAGRRLPAAQWLPRLYRQRGYSPIWSRDGKLSMQAFELLDALRKCGESGLEPEDYSWWQIQSRCAGSGSPGERAELDLLLSDACLRYISDLMRGRLQPDERTKAWYPELEQADIVAACESCLAAKRLADCLHDLEPGHSFYLGLRSALAELEAVRNRGGWQKVPPGPALRRGDGGKRVARLIGRLIESGDLAVESSRPLLFDRRLEDALRRFQERHGCETTGIADAVTLSALNVPVERRLQQVRLNLERWRAWPHDLGKDPVIVNTSGFMLFVPEAEDPTVQHMKIVVGNRDWPTPVFRGTLDGVILNPHWDCPRSVFLKEIINYIRADANYLKSNRMLLVRLRGGWESVLNPEAIDWQAVSGENLDFIMRQQPYPQNILGSIKIAASSPYDVFLHDTPYREDFLKARRIFSHGCIRLENAAAFTLYLLRDQPGWSARKITAVIAKNEEAQYPLARPVPLHVVYCTAWRDETGAMHFRDDVYGRDLKLQKTLEGKENRIFYPPRD